MATSSGSNRASESRPSRYPGERLGRPETGPGSVARVGRRVVALIIDWVIASALASVITGSWNASTNAQPLHQVTVYGLWVAIMIVSVPIAGGTLGQRLCSIAVAPLNGGWPGLWRPLVRAVLLGLLVPALVWDSDSRGFHDKVAGTILLRT
jgi:uncharacterized RDD family membrane protein YckC